MSDAMTGPMLNAILQFILVALVIIGAGAALTRFADKIADETGFGRALIGSILLAGATSLPELMVDINAVRLGQPDLAVGDLLGSSLFNLLILAMVDSAFRHLRRAFTSDFAHHAQTAVLSINLTALVGVGILSRVTTSFAGIGIFTWIVGVVYVIGARLSFTRQETQSALHPSENLPTHGKRKSSRLPLYRACAGFLVAAAVILLAAPFLVHAADRIAQDSGLGHTFVGTTLVALSTSLPELVATIAAFRMGAPDLALGNIFGSNTFNMLLFFPLDVLFPAPLFSVVRPTHALTAFSVITVSSVAVLGQISRRREKSRIWEPSSELILVLTLAFLFLLYKVKVN